MLSVVLAVRNSPLLATGNYSIFSECCFRKKGSKEMQMSLCRYFVYLFVFDPCLFIDKKTYWYFSRFVNLFFFLLEITPFKNCTKRKLILSNIVSPKIILSESNIFPDIPYLVPCLENFHHFHVRLKYGKYDRN